MSREWVKAPPAAYPRVRAAVEHAIRRGVLVEDGDPANGEPTAEEALEEAIELMESFIAGATLDGMECGNTSAALAVLRRALESDA